MLIVVVNCCELCTLCERAEAPWVILYQNFIHLDICTYYYRQSLFSHAILHLRFEQMTHGHQSSQPRPTNLAFLRFFFFLILTPPRSKKKKSCIRKNGVYNSFSRLGQAEQGYIPRRWIALGQASIYHTYHFTLHEVLYALSPMMN